MAAKGSIAKAEVMEKILELFGEDSFSYNGGKEIRINTEENGENIQIKVVLTAAKVAVGQGDENALPGAKKTPAPKKEKAVAEAVPQGEMVEFKATEEEQNNLENVLKELDIQF